MSDFRERLMNQIRDGRERYVTMLHDMLPESREIQTRMAGGALSSDESALIDRAQAGFHGDGMRQMADGLIEVMCEAIRDGDVGQTYQFYVQTLIASIAELGVNIAVTVGWTAGMAAHMASDVVERMAEEDRPAARNWMRTFFHRYVLELTHMGVEVTRSRGVST